MIIPTVRAVSPALALIAVLAFGAAPAPAQIPSHILTVEKVGGGTVTGPGIDCGSDCQETIKGTCAYDPDWEEVLCEDPQATLTATAANGFAFDSWTGCAPADERECDVHLGDDTTVTAHFADVQDPEASLTDPGTTAARGGTITLAASAYDNGAVKRVEFYVRNVKVGQDTTAPYSITFDTTSVADGPALVEALAVDAADRTSTRPGRTITIDNTDPTVSISAGPNGQTFGPGTTQAFTFTAGDGASGVKKVECRIDTGAYGPCSGVTTGHSVSNLGHGGHSFGVKVTDNVGRTAEQTRAWAIDAAPPATTLTSPTAGSRRGTIDLAATATDAAGVQRVEFWVGGAKVGEDASSPYGGAYDTTQQPDGAAATVAAKAYDAYGNAATASVVVTIDNGAPTIVFDAGPDGATFGPHTTQTWAFTAGDAVSGVSQVRCSVDGAAFAPCDDANSGHSIIDAAGGAHTLDVRATDGAGNEKTVRRTWTIDASGPVVSITSGPADGATITGTAVDFAFSADEGATYRCRVSPAALTPPAFGDCSGPGTHAANGFAPGTYAFEVQGVDRFGTAGAAVKRTFVVPGGSTPPPGGGPGPGRPGAPGSPERVTTPLVFFFNWSSPKGTKVVRLKVGPVEPGVSVAVACKGGGCPFARKAALKAKGRYVNVAPLFKKKLLRPGAVITITMTRPGAIAKAMRFTVVKRKAPKVKTL